MPPQLQQFATLTRQFCNWAENPSQQQPPGKEARLALQLVSSLYQQALHLQAPPLTNDAEASGISHEEWKTIFQRFSSLPFSYYMQCSTPQNVPDDVPGVADLADDMADIWRDLKGGLDLFDAGHVSAAVWQ